MFDLSAPNAVAAEGLDVFILEAGAGRVRRCGSLSGCGSAPALVASAPATGPAALGPTRIYWTALPPVNAVYAAPRGGAPAGALAPLASAQANPTAIATDDARVYWTALDDGAVRACPLDGCAGRPIDVATGQAGPSGLASDGTHLYWANAAAGTVVRCPAAGCGAAGPTTLARGLAGPSAVALDAAAVWVVTGGRTQIVRIPR